MPDARRPLPGMDDGPDALLRYRSLVDTLPAVVFVDVVAAEGEQGAPARTAFLSAGVREMTGHPAEDFYEDPGLFDRLIHPDDAPTFLSYWARQVAAEEPYEGRYRLCRPDGSIAWIHDRAGPIRDDEGTLVGWQGVLFDITATKEAEDALLSAEGRYRTLVEQLPVVVYSVTDTEVGEAIYVSPSSLDILGIAPDRFFDDLAFPRFVAPEDRPAAMAAWTRAFEETGRFEAEYRMLRPDGETLWIRDTAMRIRPTDGPPFWQGVMLDVTAEKAGEAELIRSQARYRALVENVPVVVYEMDDDDERRTLYVSPRIEELLGYGRQEWLDQPDIWTELLHPDDRESELEAHDRLSRTGEPWAREYRLIASDGREVWVRDQARLIRDAVGRAVAWQGVLLDITPQKEAEAQLHEANERLEMRVLERTAALEEANALMALEISERRRAEAHLRDAEERARILIEEIPAAPYRWQVWARTPDDWTEMYVSPAIERILGYTPSEWNNAGELWRSRVHPHDRERVTAAAEHSTRTGEPYEVEARYLARDGRVVWVLDRATLLRRNERGEPWVFQGVMVDVTERKEAEQQAHDAERRFSAIIEKGPDVTYSYTREHGSDGSTLRVDYVSPQMARLLGYDEPWWIDRPEEWFEMIHPDDRERVESTVRDVWSTGARWDMEYRMLRADGSLAWFHDRGRCVAGDERGQPTQFLGSISEVTARTEERIGLAQERDRYKELVESIPAIVWTETVDEEGRSTFTYISPNVVGFLGYTAEELMAERRHFARLVHPADVERVTAGGEATDAAGLNHWEDEYRVRHRDGSVRWLRARARRATPPGETPAVWHGVTVDVTTQHASDATSVEASTDVASD